jgi:hypothetical protein
LRGLYALDFRVEAVGDLLLVVAALRVFCSTPSGQVVVASSRRWPFGEGSWRPLRSPRRSWATDPLLFVHSAFQNKKPPARLDWRLCSANLAMKTGLRCCRLSRRVRIGRGLRFLPVLRLGVRRAFSPGEGFRSSGRLCKRW